MKAVVAPDKFKHSLSSLEACLSIKQGLEAGNAGIEVNILPMADGGDGMAEIIGHYLPAEQRCVRVQDPLFRTIDSSFLLTSNNKTAYIEMAKASGLLLLSSGEQNCMYTSTCGTGQLIKEALLSGATEIIIGIGGSATNDCGIGMAEALGYRFLDKNGAQVEPVGMNLGQIERIDSTAVPDLSAIRFTVACDVKNPLTGDNGASRVFAGQKGASATEIELLERGMLHFAEIIQRDMGKDVSAIAGTGAAGGLGAGCMAFINASLLSGIELVLQISKAEEYIKEADVVITGEGRIDRASLNGKVISGLAGLCKKHDKPLIAFCGELNLTAKETQESGLHKVCNINPAGISKEEAFRNAALLLEKKAFETGSQLSKLF